jgi:antitoxin YefM
MTHLRPWTCQDQLVILLTMSSVPLAEVKAHLSEFVQRVGTQHERVTITVHGRPAAVLVSLDELESLEETIAVLGDDDLRRQLAEAEADIAAGRLTDAADLADAMRRRRPSAD